jgi:hypothetical protein
MTMNFERSLDLLPGEISVRVERPDSQTIDSGKGVGDVFLPQIRAPSGGIEDELTM